jgi:hypothetical protein
MPIWFRYGLLVTAAGLFFTMTAYAHEISAPATAARMFQTAESFLNSLAPDQRKRASFPFEDEERCDWHYVPRSRSGLPLKDMTADQQALALSLLKVALSQNGYWKSATIMKLEAVLREIESFDMGRDPQKYYFSFFGPPSENGTWGWRVEGHHLSLNFTIINGHLLASAPRFLGANPAEVAAGELSGVRTLAGEEDLARKLLLSLNPEQKRKAVFRKQAYHDIVTGSDEIVSPLDPVGIPAAQLDEAQRDLLDRLIDEYVSALPPEIARQRIAAVRSSALDQIYFGWAGGIEPGRPHYYRIQGSTFLIEYDNVQNGANHIHTVWRDFDGDFGRDLLGEHYRTAHQ